MVFFAPISSLRVRRRGRRCSHSAPHPIGEDQSSRGDIFALSKLAVLPKSFLIDKVYEYVKLLLCKSISQDSEGDVVATAGPPQCGRPQVPLGRLPF